MAARDLMGRFVAGSGGSGGAGGSSSGFTWVGMKVRTRSDIPKVLRKVQRSRKRIIYTGAGLVRTIARRSIRTTKKPDPSPAGSPPRTRGPKRVLRNAILFAVEGSPPDNAVIGPTVEIAGSGLGPAHELGEIFRGTRYDERAFMGPALETAAPEYAELWRHSI